MTKPTKPQPKQLSTNTSKKNFNSFQKFLLFLSMIIVCFTVFQPMVVLFLGLLPTLTVVVTDPKNINKITTIGCFNLSGTLICLNNLFSQISSGAKFSINANIYNIALMLAASALGMILFYIMPDLFAYIFKNSAQHRLKTINAKLEKLSKTWTNILPED